MKHTYTRKRRKIKWLNVIVLFASIMLLLSCISLQALGRNDISYTPKAYMQVYVQSGDTIWDLIKEYNPHYDGNMEKAIWEVRQANKLNHTNLKIGQMLLIPLDL